ncbi:DUF6222 family protein [Amycolatopsis albispora]|uniref:Uncharacterized protein n=1 Tax=Amycolatopsis albispora TaxID=1804986 RepID=A0A344LH95_9PSEU|nr:DUF6222 family protein [Amycolatopsis albispora]AXB47419.1 hypothetical protein A4R43_37320 [Amycolatopsis albispora]
MSAESVPQQADEPNNEPIPLFGRAEPPAADTHDVPDPRWLSGPPYPSVPRLGRGLRWSDLVAQMEADHAEREARRAA